VAGLDVRIERRLEELGVPSGHRAYVGVDDVVWQNAKILNLIAAACYHPVEERIYL
jgi:hypothetical protein